MRMSVSETQLNETQLVGSWEYGLVEALVDDEPAQNMRILRGPHYEAFAGICNQLTEAVADIAPDYEGADFHQPSRYLAEAELDMRYAAFRDMEPIDRRTVAREIDAFRQRLAGYGESIFRVSDTQETTLPCGTLDRPRFVRQFGGMACTAACISMLFQEITGDRLCAPKFEKAMTEYLGVVAHSSEYAKLFDGKLFRELFDVDVSQLEITGASLPLIRRIAEKTRSKLPDARVFCSVPLQSDAFPDTWHHAILVSDEGLKVTILDPKAELHREGYQIRKREFYRRWAAGFFRAHIYIANPAEVQH